MIEYTVKVHRDRTQWFLNGKLHRENGPAVEFVSGTKDWYLNGKLHREDGPAVEFADGSKSWYLNGKLQPEDGPAIECSDGTKEWYLLGRSLTEAEFDTLQKIRYTTEEVYWQDH